MRSSSAPVLVSVDAPGASEDAQLEGIEALSRIGTPVLLGRPNSNVSACRPSTGWSCSASSSVGTNNRPTSGWSCSTMDTATKPPKGGLTPEERTCFRRVYAPSPDLKRTINEASWHTLPLQKGKGFAKSALDTSSQSLACSSRKCLPKVELLPDEFLTAKILNEIYPRTPRKAAKEDQSELELSMSTNQSPERLSPMSASAAFSTDERKAQKSIRFQKDHVLTTDSYDLSSTYESKTPDQKLGRSPPQQPQKLMDSPLQAFATPLTPLSAMIDFLKLLLDRHDSLDEAMKALWAELDHPQYMTKKDLRRYLQKYSLNLAKGERDAVFKHLDLDGDGHVTRLELDLAVGSACPVKTLTDLRRRWLTAGILSIEQAIEMIQDAGYPVFNRMSLRDFGEALSILYVTEHDEHLALFNSVLDPSDRHSRVAISELLAAVAALSPSVLLESLRIHLQKKYAGNLDRAFTDIDVHRKGLLRRKEFIAQVTIRFGLNEREASKMFRQIDVGSCGQITRADFLSALACSQSCIFLEDLRRKILQRFRSIELALQKACADETVEEGDKVITFAVERFQEILRAVEFTDEEIYRLFCLIDFTQADELTCADFLKGTVHFAPGSVFENLHLECVCRQRPIFETFMEHGMPKDSPLEFQAFEDILEELGLVTGVNVAAIYDILDIVHDGTVTLGMLIATLQAGGAGAVVKRSEEEADIYARQDVRGCISGVHKMVLDVKSQCRPGDADAEKANYWEHVSKEDLARSGAVKGGAKISTTSPIRGAAFQKSKNREQLDSEGKQTPLPRHAKSKVKRPAGSRSVSNRQPLLSSPAEKNDARGSANGESGIDLRGVPGRGSKDGKEKIPPRLRSAPHQDIMFYVAHQASCPPAGPRKASSNQREDSKHPSQNMPLDNQQSWNHVWRRLQNASGQKDRQGLEKDLQNYYQTATWSLSHDVPLLEKAHSRYALFTSTRKHNAMLDTDKQKCVQKLATES